MDSIDRQTQESMDEADPYDQPDRAAMRSELRRFMETRIDSLPEAFRSVFMLRAVQELSVEETSAALQIPETTVRTRFLRARSMLRKGLARHADLSLGDAFAFDGARCDRIVATVLAQLAANSDVF